MTWQTCPSDWRYRDRPPAAAAAQPPRSACRRGCAGAWLHSAAAATATAPSVQLRPVPRHRSATAAQGHWAAPHAAPAHSAVRDIHRTSTMWVRVPSGWVTAAAGPAACAMAMRRPAVRTAWLRSPPGSRRAATDGSRHSLPPRHWRCAGRALNAARAIARILNIELVVSNARHKQCFLERILDKQGLNDSVH